MLKLLAVSRGAVDRRDRAQKASKLIEIDINRLIEVSGFSYRDADDSEDERDAGNARRNQREQTHAGLAHKTVAVQMLVDSHDSCLQRV